MCASLHAACGAGQAISFDLENSAIVFQSFATCSVGLLIDLVGVVGPLVFWRPAKAKPFDDPGSQLKNCYLRRGLITVHTVQVARLFQLEDLQARLEDADPLYSLLFQV